jgi:hypothetical protein
MLSIDELCGGLSENGNMDEGKCRPMLKLCLIHKTVKIL